MNRFLKKIHLLENFKTIRDYLPEDHSNRQILDQYITQLLPGLTCQDFVLDLGCGKGDSVEFIKKVNSEVNWRGVDIENSPEVKNRTRKNDHIMSFDGVNLPYDDDYFDIIYCKQVLEHVRHPDQLIAESLRVLKPKGLFLGSVSYLEPYHSHSIFNFTPFGIVTVFREAGFELSEIRPGLDALHLIFRQLMNRSKLFKFFWNRNYLHAAVDVFTNLARIGHCERNFLKIQFAGQLIFVARCPSKFSDS